MHFSMGAVRFGRLVWSDLGLFTKLGVEFSSFVTKFVPACPKPFFLVLSFPSYLVAKYPELTWQELVKKAYFERIDLSAHVSEFALRLSEAVFDVTYLLVACLV